MEIPRSDALTCAEPDPESWGSWRWQLQNMITDAAGLSSYIEISDEERLGLEISGGRFRFGLTPYYARLMDPKLASCPIRRQAIPSPQELDFAPGELADPLGEDAHRPVSSIVHKYPDRVLLLVVDRCAIYCRHCNRRRLVGGDAPPTRDDLDQGLEYIRRTPRVRDVLLSGGDPLLLSTRRLHAILGALRDIRHVETVRIGTRMPVVCPMRIDPELTQMLARHHPLYINTHFNHPKELTAAARDACIQLVNAGIPVGNQTVLLRGINSSTRCLRALFRELLRVRVRPYYLFQGDTVTGTDHLRTPVEAAIALQASLRGWITGMAIPHLVIDAPRGGGKIPIGPETIVGRERDEWILRSYRGDTVRYPEPRHRECAVDYDAVYFARERNDDDREGSQPDDGQSPRG